MKWDKPLKKSTVIVIVEISMLLGIILAALILPRNTPLWLFLAASGACFVAGNVYLFVGRKRIDDASAAGASERKPRLNLVLITMGVILLLLYLVNKL
jgi:hypothetical protein